VDIEESGLSLGLVGHSLTVESWILAFLADGGEFGVDFAADFGFLSGRAVRTDARERIPRVRGILDRIASVGAGEVFAR